MRLALLLGWSVACSGGTEGSGPPEAPLPDTGVSTGTSTSTPTTPDPTDTGTPLAPMSDFSIAPDDPNIRYVGRWNFEDPLAPWAAWQGASVVLSFEGTDLSVTLDAGVSREWFRVIIDGDSAGSVKFPVDNVMTTYPLATGLPQGPHTVELVKESYQGTNATLFGFDITGVGEALLAAPDRMACHSVPRSRNLDKMSAFHMTATASSVKPT